MTDSTRRLLAVVLIGLALVIGGPLLAGGEDGVAMARLGLFVIFGSLITGAVLLVMKRP